MTWLDAGYLPKRRLTLAEWKSPYERYPDAPFPCGRPVEEICSVSQCIAKPPADWDAAGNTNWHFWFDDPDTAWNCVPVAERAVFAMYFYRLYERQFVDGQEQPWRQADYEIEASPPPSSFVLIGYDACICDRVPLGCSPLSCNGQAGMEYLPPVNRYGLVNTAQEGLELARYFSVDQPEPGAYCAVEVWREIP